jgi:hypothetical protein
MKVVISERQYNFIREQYLYHTPETAKHMQIGFQELRKKPYGDSLISLGLWFVPYIGPYLSAGFSTLTAVEKIKKGNTVEGIIELITSPLALMKTIKILSVSGGSKEMLKMLQTINKTGITVLVSEGQEAFLKWGYKKFGANFVIFINLLVDQLKMKTLLSQFKDPNLEKKPNTKKV